MSRPNPEITPEDRARWTKAMRKKRDWKKVPRVHKDYQDEMRKELAQYARPTVENALEAFAGCGNERFLLKEYYEKLDSASIDKKFGLMKSYNKHDIMHIAMELSPTPEQECLVIPSETGFLLGLRTFNDPKAAQYIASEVSEMKNWYKEIVENGLSFMSQEQWEKRMGPMLTNKQPMAIYFAACLYLREKVDCFAEQGLMRENYDTQRTYIDHYADPENDHSPGKPLRMEGRQPICDKHGGLNELGYPDTLMHLEPREWDAIRAVATGVKDPDKTLYPKRMEAVKNALLAAGLFHDLKPTFADSVKNQGENIARTEGKLDPYDEKRHTARHAKNLVNKQASAAITLG